MNPVFGLVVIVLATAWVACSMGSAEPLTPTPESAHTLMYFGPDCPDAYPNCGPFPSADRFLILKAYSHSSETSVPGLAYQYTPDLSISCINGRYGVMLTGGGLPIATPNSKVTATVSPELTEYLAPKFGSEDQETIYFPNSSETLIGLMLKAEALRPYMRVVASSDYATVVADFDLRGLGINFLRLPCA